MSDTHLLFDAPGRRTRRRVAVLNVFGTLIVLGILVWVLLALGEKGQLAPSKWEPFLQPSAWLDNLLPGALRTLEAAGIAMVASIVFGLVFGMGRLSQQRIVRAVSTAIVEFCRAVPVLIMMIFLWYLLSFNQIVDGEQSPFVAVVIGLTLYNGSVIAELVRSGVHTLPKGQGEAGLSIGLTPGQTLRNIQLPQALLAMTPSVVAQMVVVLKDTALGYLVTYPELLRQARLLGSSNGNLLPALIVAGLMFLVINLALGWLAERLSRTLSQRTSAPVKTGAPVDEEAAPVR
ncbi:amino acid ABC transporter permease [Agromyces archimandritae]|uniref:Amino acid ABC transporter permease n=1 Tax=Agromyces archimandritae TaxID=2781962 RepID=A0A975FPK7_9MICO|nr:amino acid ABC transporter permease [Agromyces archimandritae]QTX06040.1 amino acid ABC transporter permease [Agromyces archimandritae]